MYTVRADFSGILLNKITFMVFHKQVKLKFDYNKKIEYFAVGRHSVSSFPDFIKFIFK